MKQLVTRVYFEGELLNADDPILNLVGEPERRNALIAKRGNGKNDSYIFDIRLQGPGETVFFEV
jgi:protocatechuate 3,4-dioxygenase, alpha subunit